MTVQMEKYEGQTVEIIYMATEGRLSQRLIEVRRVKGEFIRALCLKSGQPRTFRADRILAAYPVIRRVG
jgi:predicted DNA-binding transcriptional regulator YafY